MLRAAVDPEKTLKTIELTIKQLEDSLSKEDVNLSAYCQMKTDLAQYIEMRKQLIEASEIYKIFSEDDTGDDRLLAVSTQSKPHTEEARVCITPSSKQSSKLGRLFQRTNERREKLSRTEDQSELLKNHGAEYKQATHDFAKFYENYYLNSFMNFFRCMCCTESEEERALKQEDRTSYHT